MLCDFCHEREAVIFLEQMTGAGQRRKINICSECALERGISPDPRSIESSLGDLFKELSTITRQIQRENNRLCPVCGTSIGSIRKSGQAGCPECYAIFKDDIRKYLVHKGVKGIYTGSLPVRLSNVRSVLNNRLVLEDKLTMAVRNEEYEKAALYRDCLNALENKAVSDGEVTDDETGAPANSGDAS